MARQARKKSGSGIYHVMLRGANRQTIFLEPEDYEKYLQVLAECKAISGCKIYAYCLMRNHVHLLLQEGDEPIEQIMKRIAVRFVYWYNAKYQRIGHLFQDRFKSEPVEDDAYLLTVLRYIHQNPVKAGLCGSVSDYRYSSYNDYFSNSSLIDRDFIFSLLRREDFGEFHRQTSFEQCLEMEPKAAPRLTDQQAQQVIEKHAGCKNALEFQRMSSEAKGMAVRCIHGRGVSIRQIFRLCGETKGTIEKWLK